MFANEWCKLWRRPRCFTSLSNKKACIVYLPNKPADSPAHDPWHLSALDVCIVRIVCWWTSAGVQLPLFTTFYGFVTFDISAWRRSLESMPRHEQDIFPGKIFWLWGGQRQFSFYGKCNQILFGSDYILSLMYITEPERYTNQKSLEKRSLAVSFALVSSKILEKRSGRRSLVSPHLWQESLWNCASGKEEEDVTYNPRISASFKLFCGCMISVYDTFWIEIHMIWCEW